MVRRWSYVNLLNRSSVSAFKVFACFGNEIIFKETTVFRKYKTEVSIVRRKAWGRRRHLHQWTIYIRILFDWARDYNFFKKFSSWLFKNAFFQNSFVTYNFLLLLTKSSGFYPGLENVNTLTLNNNLITFFFKTTTFQPFIWTFIKNSSTLYVTTSQKPVSFLKSTTILPPLLFPSANTTIVPLPASNTNVTLSTINSLSLSLVMSKIVCLYNIFSLLTISRLKNNFVP